MPDVDKNYIEGLLTIIRKNHSNVYDADANLLLKEIDSVLKTMQGTLNSRQIIAAVVVLAQEIHELKEEIYKLKQLKQNQLMFNY